MAGILGGAALAYLRQKLGPFVSPLDVAIFLLPFLLAGLTGAAKTMTA